MKRRQPKWPAWGYRQPPHQTAVPIHVMRREGDEWACSCGRRWALDETHPPMTEKTNDD